MEPVKRTPLASLHRRLGARTTEFGGYDMPLSYRGIIEEHLAVRRAAGLFDLSHMGEFHLEGPHALPLLERAYRLDQDGDIGAHWGEVLWALGDKAKARDTWNRALMVDPDNSEVKAAQHRAGVPSVPLQGPGTAI